MKKLALLVLVLIVMVSCKSHMISTVSSNTASKEVTSGAFFIENDSVKISYNFTGENSPLTVEVYNKLNEPVYVNWEQSAVIVDDKAYSFVDDKLAIEGNTSSVSLNYQSQYDTYNYGDFFGTVKLSKNAGFIPPKSQVSRTMYALNTINTFKLDQTAFEKKAMNYTEGSGIVYVKQANYSPSDSPIQFRCYVTLYTVKEGAPKAFSFEQRFWVSTIMKSGANPSKFTDYQPMPANLIVNSKSTGFTKAMTVVAIVGAAGGVSAADAALSEKNNSVNK
jgi:hypothetical protein